MISVKVIGGKAAANKLKNYGLVIKGASARAISKIALRVSNDAKQFAPVDLGELRASIGIDFDPSIPQAIVGPTVNYAAPVEFGSRPHFPPVEPLAERGTSPHPFLRPAAMQAKQYAPGIVSADIKQAIK